MKFGNSVAHAIWLGCVRICHFYRTLCKVTFFVDSVEYVSERTYLSKNRMRK